MHERRLIKAVSGGGGADPPLSATNHDIEEDLDDIQTDNSEAKNLEHRLLNCSSGRFTDDEVIAT